MVSGESEEGMNNTSQHSCKRKYAQKWENASRATQHSPQLSLLTLLWLLTTQVFEAWHQISNNV